LYNLFLYCQVGGAIDMAEFSINGKYGAIKNSGLDKDLFDIVFICWKTPPETYAWLDSNNFKYYDMQYDEGKGFLWNLYKGWNYGYEVSFSLGAEYVCPIATDHAFHKNWLKNLYKHAKPNRIVNSKLIEPGNIPSLHITKNFGVTTEKDFIEEGFTDFCNSIEQDKLIFEDIVGRYHENRGIGGAHGHRLDAMPFLLSKDVWVNFGPMLKSKNMWGTTGDTDFFDRCKLGGVEITKSLDAISYHCGGIETKRNMSNNVYT
jgi:hypothetical protein